MVLVTNLPKRIAQIEAKADESALLGSLSADPEARVYNRRLTDELREYAKKLKMQHELQENDGTFDQSDWQRV